MINKFSTKIEKAKNFLHAQSNTTRKIAEELSKLNTAITTLSNNSSHGTFNSIISELSEIKKFANATDSSLSSDFSTLLNKLEEMNSKIEKLDSSVASLRGSVEIIQSASNNEVMSEAFNFAHNHVQTPIETLRMLASTDNSITRFGDGELRMVLDPLFHLGFQKQTPELTFELENILRNPVDGLMVALPQYARGPVWQKFWTEYWYPLAPMLSKETIYANAHVSRYLVFQQYGEEATELWRSVWQDKEVVVVTGKGSRFDLTPKLFDSVSSIRRVDSLPKQAYSDVPRILENPEVLNAELVLLSLGPAATVLAKELHLRGVRSLDIGHLTASYNHIMEGGAFPEQMPFSS